MWCRGSIPVLGPACLLLCKESDKKKEFGKMLDAHPVIYHFFSWCGLCGFVHLFILCDRGFSLTFTQANVELKILNRCTKIHIYIFKNYRNKQQSEQRVCLSLCKTSSQESENCVEILCCDVAALWTEIVQQVDDVPGAIPLPDKRLRPTLFTLEK